MCERERKKERKYDQKIKKRQYVTYLRVLTCDKKESLKKKMEKGIKMKQ